MTGSNVKTQGFQRLSETSVGFALCQLDSEKVALFSGAYSAEKAPDFTRAQLFAPDFYRSADKPWLNFETVEVLSLTELEDWARKQLKSGSEIQWDEPSFSDFSSQVNRIEAAFNAHELHKAVPTVFATSKRSETDPSVVQMLARSVFNRGERMLYALVLEDQGMIGATPETLFDFDLENNITSMALAGTRATEAEASDPLLSDSKEIHEHNLVLFEIKEKLQAFGEVESGLTDTWNIGTLTHLRTDITVKPSEQKKPEVLFTYLEKALHPTPALGVASETLNFTWLKDLPGAKPRYRFGAPFGVWHPELGAKVFVAIRNIQWTEDEWILGSGCGYVPASKVDKEWKELELKRASVKALFERAND